ncbi:hypothetical protein SLEP1_g43011 [Rubroshorea leprosula]|uniref:Uncharacterized protein n=1 Tax=Rubroshorea leprosula TaxID=152421 RepID=A0AAV5LC32_9ROSI|nr:hypothetical protein SLEP1_g43011 [Rubroshorea leprosula]
MESEDIDWNNIESVFEEDDAYENINAPKWVDLSAPCECVDNEAWFCKSGCKHPKSVEDFHRLKQNQKGKLLRSLSISEILPFRDITRRETKTKKGVKVPKSAGNFSEDIENKNPNLSSTPPVKEKTLLKLKKPSTKSTTEKKIGMKMDDCGENLGKIDRKPGLRSTFSARKLVPGRETMSQITDFCAELKKMVRKGSKKGASVKA